MRTSHLLGLAVAATFALLAPNASAFTNVTVGDPARGDLVSPTVGIGTFMACTGSTMELTVTQDAGPDAGGSLEVHDASFSGCMLFGSAATFTPDMSTPWPVTFHSHGVVTIRGFNFTMAWAGQRCHYSGDVTGTYNESTGNMTLSGNVNRQSGSYLCPSSSAISGTYQFTNALTGDPIEL